VIRYRFAFRDLLTDDPIVELPLSGVSYSRRISSVGTFQGSLTIPMDGGSNDLAERVRRICPHVTADGGRNQVPPAAIYALRSDGGPFTPWWGGMVVNVQLTSAAQGAVQVTIAGNSWEQHLHRGYLESDIDALSGVDQFDIARTLWQARQDQPGGDIGVTYGTELSGVLRDRTQYLVANEVNLGDALDQLANVLNGFEYTIDTFMDTDGSMVKRLRLASEISGTRSNLPIFSMSRNGGNLLAWSAQEDYTSGNTVYYARGAQADDGLSADLAPPVSDAAAATDLLAAGWPRYVAFADYSTVSSQSVLDDHATANRDLNAGAAEMFTATVRVGNSGWTPNMLGSDHRFKIRDAMGDLDFTRRVIGYTVSLSDTGAESIAFEFQPPPAIEGD